MKIIKLIQGNELYLFAGGSMIYKRWLNTGQSRMFYDGEGQRVQATRHYGVI